MYDLLSGDMYTVDKWCFNIQDFRITDSNGTYKPTTNYNLIGLTIDDVKYYKKHKKFNEIIEKQINDLLDKDKYFFRVSQRSPKDAYLKEYKPKSSYHYSKLLELEKIRKEKLLVSNIDQIYTLIKKSKRVTEDLNLFIKQSDIKHLYLVFQNWRPSDGVEYRLFIRNQKVIGICLYKPEFYSTRTVIPVEILLNFAHSFINFDFIKKNYTNMILDLFVNNNRVYFIEINPYEKYVDPFDFTWSELDNTNHLIVKV